MESLCCDHFFSMCRNMDASTQPRVLKILVGFLENAPGPDDEDTFPPTIAAVYERYMKMVKALVCLLSPLPNFMGSSPEAVAELRSYKGKNCEESALRDVIADPRQKVWAALVDDMLSKWESTEASLPKLEEYGKVLKRMSELDDADIPTLDAELLADAARELPKLQKQLRKGLGVDEMKLLKDVLCKFAGFLSKTRPGEASIRTTAFTGVQDGLNCFADEAGVAKLCDALSRWFKNSEKHLASSELMTICRTFPEDLQAPMNASNLGAFIDAWQNCPREIIENFQGVQETDYHHALDWIFRVIAGIVKAGEGNLIDEVNESMFLGFKEDSFSIRLFGYSIFAISYHYSTIHYSLFTIHYVTT